MVKIAPTTLTAILAILSHTADAQSSAELTLKKFQKRVNVRTFVTRHRPVRHGRITVDATCEADTTALEDIEELNNAYDKLEDDVGEPDCDVDEDSAECTLDYAPYSAEVTDLCTSNGGKVYTTGFKLSCSGDGLTVTYEALNIPLCSGSSCSDDELDELFEDSVEVFEDELDSAVDGDCEVDVGSSGVVRVAFAISTVIISTMSFLF
mmetsp:Transcript_15401/g.23863  ORF Transcript_15401/g.23863 Transcript_15401/m.23863 type:complete len:208 (-) Transcript_15401:409-1032(-)